MAGGSLNYAQLQQLWIQNGGRRSAAPMAAAIALAESSGRQNAVGHNSNGTVDRGYWQINSIHGSQSTLDPRGNVRAAIAISGNGSNWQPWTTYNTGAYKPFLKGAATAPIGSLGASVPGMRPVTTHSFDQAGFQQAKQAAIAGNYLQSSGKSPFDIGPKTGLESSNPLIGILGTQAPNPQDYMRAQTTLQRIAGSSAPLVAHPAAVDAAGYSNPFAGAQVTPSRVDQGVDYGVSGPIRAIGNGRVVAILQYQGFGTYLVYQLADGPHRGAFVYVSEGMSPTVHPGQRLRAGQQIAEGHGGIETGFAQGGPTYLPMAKITGGYSEGQRTAAGQAFDRLMHALGAPRGTTSGRPLVGHYP